MNSNNLKILVVDDETEVCEYMAAHLRRKGYDALIADSAEAALPIIKEQNPDIILLDINLPGMSGIDLLKLVRQFNTIIKVVVISGYLIDFQHDEQFKGLCILESLQKPVPFSTLDSALERIIKEEKNGYSQINS